MIDLQVSRKQIDEIDSQIVKLFEERMKVANEVAKYKMETGKAVFDKEREEQKLDSLSKICHGKFNERAVRELFSQIMSISRKYQYGVLTHTDDITRFGSVIEKRPDDTVDIPELIADNERNLAECRARGLGFILIDKDYDAAQRTEEV